MSHRNNSGDRARRGPWRIGYRIQGVSNNSGTVLMLKIDAAVAVHEEAISIDPMGAN